MPDDGSDEVADESNQEQYQQQYAQYHEEDNMPVPKQQKNFGKAYKNLVTQMLM